MKCPKCGQELKPSKKDPAYMLCYSCKKKFKVPKDKHSEEGEAQKYSNIPPKKVRDKRETEMRKAYDELLSVEEDKKKKSRKREETDDDYFEYEEEKGSKAPFIILGIAIVAVAALIVYMMLFR